MSATKIGWTDLTLNPVIGCTHAAYEQPDGKKVAHPGCMNCYAEKMCSREFPAFSAHNHCSRGGKWTGKIEVLHERLTWPFTRKEYKPRRDREQRRCFLTSLSDMGHPGLAEADWMAVQGMMLLAPWIMWQDLTKRPERQRALLEKYTPAECALEAIRLLTRMGLDAEDLMRMVEGRAFVDYYGKQWSDFRHIHRYVSVSDQATADALIPELLKMPCAVHGVSLEPMVGPVDLRKYLHLIDHVIVGGESGRNARPFALEWADEVIQQCKRANVPVFMKQIGSNPVDGSPPLPHPVIGKGDNMDDWPEALCVRQNVGDP